MIQNDAKGYLWGSIKSGINPYLGLQAKDRFSTTLSRAEIRHLYAGKRAKV